MLLVRQYHSDCAPSCCDSHLIRNARGSADIFFANRSQDCRLKGGREECIERAGRLPVRTLHTITKSIADEPRDFETSENVELVDGEVKPADEALGGFLIGAGNEGVNCRISALAKHRPAEDGGNLAVIEGRVLALGE